jgi:hypothetical protein
MLVSVLPVPPPPVRPSVMMDSSARCEVSQLSGRALSVSSAKPAAY